MTRFGTNLFLLLYLALLVIVSSAAGDPVHRIRAALRGNERKWRLSHGKE
jgi:hypothetical protein